MNYTIKNILDLFKNNIINHAIKNILDHFYTFVHLKRRINDEKK
jgi:hypothetical protein